MEINSSEDEMFILDLVSDPSFLEQFSDVTSSDEFTDSTPQLPTTSFPSEMDSSLIQEYFTLKAESARLQQRQENLQKAIAKLVFNSDSHYREMSIEKAMEIAKSVLTPSVLQSAETTDNIKKSSSSIKKSKRAAKDSKFHPGEDADAFHAAIKGLGTDEKALIDLIISRPRDHLQKVKVAYAQKYNTPLENDIKGDTSGNLKDILIALLTDRTAYMAQQIRKAVKGIGTNESVLTQIICTQSNRRIKAIQLAYAQEFGRSLAGDVMDDLSGEMKALFATLLQATRSEESAVDEDTAKVDAKLLYDHGEGKLGTDDNIFIKIFTARSRAHMQTVDKLYKEMYGHTLADAVHKETSGNFRKALLALITPLNEYWAKRVRKAVQGLGTDNSSLIRYFCMLTKEDLKKANEWYAQKYNKTFKQDLLEEFAIKNSNYGKVLLALVPDLPQDQEALKTSK